MLVIALMDAWISALELFALALFVTGICLTNNPDNSASFDDFALCAHALDTASYFHRLLLLLLLPERRRSPRQTIRPLLKS
jgi:hypothetical protein